ncbi:MAG: radical SAM protein [Polyangiaceae bacterium]|nr:radical SAM protein [Polyangiaceae bacterium]
MYDVAAIAETAALREPLRASVSEGVAPTYLRSVKIKLTARCNLTCVMCRYGRGFAPPELDEERWRGALGEMAALGCRKVHFSGGEVLVRPDFERLVGRAVEVGLKVTLTSNLTLLGRARAKALMRHDPSSISTSLDGATSKTHERIRGIPGSFKRTLRALERLVAERERRRGRTRLRVNFVMMRRNFDEYPDVVRLAAEHGASDVVPMPVDSRRDELRLSKQLIRHYNEHVAPRVAEARARAGMPLSERALHPFGRDPDELSASALGRYAADYYQDHLCYAPYLHLFAAWDGKIYLCCMTNGRIEPLGDLRQEGVREIFVGEPFQRLRAEMLRARLPSCHACDMFLDENQALAAALGPPPAPATARRRLALAVLPMGR